MFKLQGESLQKVAAHDIGSPALGLFPDLNKANGGSFTLFSGWGLRSSFTISCLSIYTVYSQRELCGKKMFHVS